MSDNLVRFCFCQEKMCEELYEMAEYTSTVYKLCLITRVLDQILSQQLVLMGSNLLIIIMIYSLRSTLYLYFF